MVGVQRGACFGVAPGGYTTHDLLPNWQNNGPESKEPIVIENIVADVRL